MTLDCGFIPQSLICHLVTAAIVHSGPGFVVVAVVDGGLERVKSTASIVPHVAVQATPTPRVDHRDHLACGANATINQIQM